MRNEYSSNSSKRTLRQDIRKLGDKLNPKNWSEKTRRLVAVMGTTVVAAALIPKACQSEQKVPPFAECTGTQQVDVGTHESYSALVKEYTDIHRFDGSAGSTSDFNRIIRGLEMNNDPTDEYIEISSAGKLKPVGNALTVYKDGSTSVPVTCIILDQNNNH